MFEHWIEIPEFPRYMVSNCGNVYDRVRDRILTQTPDASGYMRVKVWTPRGRMTVSVHRLVAGTFYDIDPEEFSFLEVNHRYAPKSNNHLSNLEITDRSGNMIHAFDNGLARPVHPRQRVMIVETGEVFESTGQVDRYLGVSSGSVSKTLRGLQPTCKGYTFTLVA